MPNLLQDTIVISGEQSNHFEYKPFQQIILGTTMQLPTLKQVSQNFGAGAIGWPFHILASMTD